MMVKGGCMFFLSFFLFGGLHGWCLLAFLFLFMFFLLLAYIYNDIEV